MITFALHVEGEYTDSEDGWFKHGRLTGWQATRWAPDRPSIWEHSKPTRTILFWRWLHKAAASEKVIQVYGWDMWQAWCLLGGHEEIAAGYINLDIARDCFIAADLPTILTFKINGGPKVEWIDLGNLGIAKADYGVQDDRAILPAAKMAISDYRSMCYIYKLGAPAMTAASQAWRALCLRNEAVLPSPANVDFELAAYFGGRCECFRIGEVRCRLHKIDISSMYTALALNAMFPGHYVGFWRPGNDCVDEARLGPADMESRCLPIADVTLRTDMPFYPARDSVRVNRLRKPGMGMYDERVIYPIGEFRTMLCGPELTIAKAHKHVHAWHEVRYYEPVPLLQDWSAWALETRQAITRHSKLRRLAKCFKRIINSLPGKWCQHNVVWKNYPALNCDRAVWHREYGVHPITKAMTVFRTVAGKCQYMDCTQLADHSRPAVAAWWTSLGRAFTTMALFSLGADSRFYVDTDGFPVDDDGLAVIKELYGISETVEPGKFRIVASADNAEFRGIRNYLFGGEWFKAGPSPVDDESIGLSEQIRHCTDAGKASVRMATELDAFPEYKHGQVMADGVVRPFVLG